MIIGIGNDYVDIKRLEQIIRLYGDKFICRIFTPLERQKADSKNSTTLKSRASTYAKRWAAKEAFSKALGTGMSGLSWQEIEITNLPSGQPVITPFGKAKKKLEELTPLGKKVTINLSMTDDYPKAGAVVIIWAE